MINNNNKIIRLLIADDSALLRSILKEVIGKYKNFINIVGEAKNGEEAIQMNEALKPDLITMDISMPIIDGIKATKNIMETTPTPILILSNEVDSLTSFQALKFGAVDVMKKPELTEFINPEFSNQFINKLITLSKVRVLQIPKSNHKIISMPEVSIKYKIVVIGASTGGPIAIRSILNMLPDNFPIGIVIVQHLETGFDKSFSEWLNQDTKLNVRLAKDCDIAESGEVLIAPTDRHLVFNNEELYFHDGPKILNQKPSIDLLFESAANCFKESVIGILLTGMGTDGANGCIKIKSKKGYTIVQDKDTSTIYGMPRAAIENDGASIILPIYEIPNHLMSLAGILC